MSDVEDEIPNQITLDAIREMDKVMKNPNLKTYDSFDELLADPFYSEENQCTLEKRSEEIKASPAILKEHDLIEVE